MLRAVADTYFAYFNRPDLEQTWKDIAKKARYFAERRNEIAHGVVGPFYPRGLSTSEANGVCLMPAPIDTKKSNVWGASVFAYNAAALNHYALEFARLTQAPQHLAACIAIHARSLPEKSVWPNHE
jgi:hypothetical protein